MIKRVWQLQEAKNKFSEVVDEALTNGPQIITRHGRETAVVIAFDEYHKLTRPKKNLVAFFRSSPLVGVHLDLERDRDEIPDRVRE